MNRSLKQGVFLQTSLENRVRLLPSSFCLSFFVCRHFDKNQKNQLCCLCLKMTADFGNFVNKTDEKRKTKDEMNPAKETDCMILLMKATLWLSD